MVAIFGEVASLVFIYFVKYRTHNLSLSNFDLNFTGNILNLIIIGLIIFVLIISLFTQKHIKLFDLQVYLNLLFLSLLFLLLLTFLLSKDFYALKMLSSNEYEFEKVVSVLIWLIYFFIKLVGLNYLILKLFRVKSALIPKIILLTAFQTAVIIIFAFFKIFITSKSGEEYYLKKDEKFDAIVVLGAAVWKGNIPSPIYAGRLNKAIDLLEKNFSNRVILTGSNAPFELSESKVGKIYLEQKGVSPNKIYIEETTTSTIEQIHFIKNEVIGERKFKKVILVSDAFHLPRVIEISKFLSIEIKVARSNLKIELINNIWYRIKESILLAIFWLFAV
ncbi:MAG: YdcF family protein [Ignavibacteria bacterium]